MMFIITIRRFPGHAHAKNSQKPAPYYMTGNYRCTKALTFENLNVYVYFENLYVYVEFTYTYKFSKYTYVY
jgi:hypothetical protein